MSKGVAGVTEPQVKRALSFVDGQNLFHHVKAAFGHSVLNYDPLALANAICAEHGFRNVGVRFYTGVPALRKDWLRMDRVLYDVCLDQTNYFDP